MPLVNKQADFTAVNGGVSDRKGILMKITPLIHRILKIKIVYVGLLLLLLISVYIFDEKSGKFANFRMERSNNWNSGIPFHYFLVDEKDGGIVSFLVNAYLEQDGFLYFSEIDGALQQDFCYNSKDLKLSKINLSNHTLLRFIPINHENSKIFNQINQISESDRAWLNDADNRCR